MKPYLLDVNVLIALAWSSHVHHLQAQRWFEQRCTAGFRTCPLTQLGFVRVSSSVNLTSKPATPGEALALLNRIVEMPAHKFWPDDLSFPQAAKGLAILGHRQITNLYLLALAKRHGGLVATLDRGTLVLPGSSGAAELIA